MRAALKIYTSVAKELKLRVRKVWGLNFTFVEVRGEKLLRRGVGVGFPPLLHPE